MSLPPAKIRIPIHRFNFKSLYESITKDHGTVLGFPQGISAGVCAMMPVAVSHGADNQK
jgi:hypothetical protein